MRKYSLSCLTEKKYRLFGFFQNILMPSRAINFILFKNQSKLPTKNFLGQGPRSSAAPGENSSKDNQKCKHYFFRSYQNKWVIQLVALYSEQIKKAWNFSIEWLNENTEFSKWDNFNQNPNTKALKYYRLRAPCS